MDLTRGYIVGSGGELDRTIPGTQMRWQHPRNPFNYTGEEVPGTSALSCLANNATIMENCCRQVDGILFDNGTETITAINQQGYINWCRVIKIESDESPDSVGIANAERWGQCFNATADPARNPGIYYTNIDVNSNIYTCELRGNSTLQIGLPAYRLEESGAKARLAGIWMLFATSMFSLIAAAA